MNQSLVAHVDHRGVFGVDESLVVEVAGGETTYLLVLCELLSDLFVMLV